MSVSIERTGPNCSQKWGNSIGRLLIVLSRELDKRGPITTFEGDSFISERGIHPPCC